MKLPSKEEFNFKDCVIAGDECWLITPKNMGVNWTDENARFRSIILRKTDNFVVSQGFGKFVNFAEKPDFQPWNNEWPIEARHKLDGSLLIVSKYKGELICRTRGTVDARKLGNGHEIDLLIAKYPKVFNNVYFTDEWESGVSLLLEWTTPNNVIVLREHTEPTLTLLGAVTHRGIFDETSYTYWGQHVLDQIAKEWNVERPKRYHYNSIGECILDVDAWKGKEGVVLYSPDGQTLKKIKASEYCELHKLATGIKTVGQVMDIFISSPRFKTSEDFYKYIEITLDFEIAEKIKNEIEKVVLAYLTYLDKLNRLTDIVNDLTFCESRKDQAEAINSRYLDWRRAFAFKILDEQEIDAKMESKALHYELKKIEDLK